MCQGMFFWAFARSVQETRQDHAVDLTIHFVRLNDLTHPVVAGLISVIVNYGGTFILVLHAAGLAGLSPELTASWV
ncbi:hypothetical protein BOSEA31B_20527 [Hyphomicrobiales bacterium]|nr:hypothetical protein BOSEA31B_20527 [Hyphomicrobiales bacterium]CAH1702981.1 hypothetical protein BOSEA1005_30853 [Hyphomicrobiales bacterium]CAI0347166.1 hypothetical protein BO1005MUT1_540002 [Hyphomicrobiales bacterium]